MKKLKVFDVNKTSQVLLDKIENGQSLLLPDVSAKWNLSSIIGEWNIYIVHDSCHDDEKNYVADRNTVIAMNTNLGLWRIIGRELPLKEAVKLFKGKN